jgi:hypothetical protein
MELKKKRKKKCISKGIGTVMFPIWKLIEINTQEESIYLYINVEVKKNDMELLNHNSISI